MESVAEQLSNTKLGFGAQNISPKSNGAYTGEYSI
ncbi:MAG: triose-phosphate isomerase, partial [Lactococcus lactis]|nr:triose-phosphate isomerase [Lactococcus lactis]